jgi:hypothetical protein
VKRVLVVLVLLCACGHPAGDAGPNRPESPGLRGRITARTDSTDQRADATSSTRGDMKTFGYASSDVKALADEVTGVVAPASASSASYDAVELIDDAERLERLAVGAKRRLEGAEPSNRVLVGAREDGIKAFSLTAEYARLLIDLGNADKNDDLALLNSAADDALTLEGTADQLTTAYSALITELHSWARTHPKAAAEARAKYGSRS